MCPQESFVLFCKVLRLVSFVWIINQMVRQPSDHFFLISFLFTIPFNFDILSIIPHSHIKKRTLLRKKMLVFLNLNLV